jgi:transposase
VIGVDVGSKFLTVSLNDSNNQDQVLNIENNQRSILSFLRKYHQMIIVSLSKLQAITVAECFIFLWKKDLRSSLVNCMSIKHFARMKNIIAKTDAEDAKLIRLYGELFRPENYIPKSIEIEHLDQEIKLLNDLEEEKRRYTVKLKALRFNPYLNPDTEKHYERRLKQLEKEIKEVELRLPNFRMRNLRK